MSDKSDFISLKQMISKIIDELDGHNFPFPKSLAEDEIECEIRRLNQQLGQIRFYKRLLSEECEIFPIGTFVEEQVGIDGERHNRAKIIGYKWTDNKPRYVVDFVNPPGTEDFWPVGSSYIVKSENQT